MADTISSFQEDNQFFSHQIAKILRIDPWQADACIALLNQGDTVPFIARYRKEATGSLDDLMIVSIQEHLLRLGKLEDRRRSIITTIQEQGKLTPELHVTLMRAATLTELEDLYLPYKVRRKTRADRAKEQGLKPLADLLSAQIPAVNPSLEAEKYINGELGLAIGDDVLAGASDIIAETVSEDPEIRQKIRDLYFSSSIIRASAARGKKGEAGVYAEYLNYSEPIGRAPSHRILALFRGAGEGLLSVHSGPRTEDALSLISDLLVRGRSPSAILVEAAIQDGYTRLLAPAMEREVFAALKEKADRDAAHIFAENLHNLLLSPPFRNKKIMAIDPGFRTGCKVVLLDPQGVVLDATTIYPHPPISKISESEQVLSSLHRRYQVDMVAIGNGTAGRETWKFINGLHEFADLIITSISEQAASIYSASEIARQELPSLDVTMRGAVSIGRRVIDPMAEMVKIDPKSLGIGQYQHDIDPKLLSQKLTEEVIRVVNMVGVDLNTASASLLSYVSGLTPKIAERIVQYRALHGPFRSREDLRHVKGIGEQTFRLAAGFLRIPNGIEPLDNTAVHPERYELVSRMAADLHLAVPDLIGDEEMIGRIRPEQYVTAECGLPTILDVCEELKRPGRDIRGSFEPVIYEEAVQSIEDLEGGMILSGMVTNVTRFGAFIDIGIKESGLVHISEMAEHFVSDPAEIVSLHQRVRVRVITVDRSRGRISLSMKGLEQN